MRHEPLQVSDDATLLSDVWSVCLLEKKRQKASSNAWGVQGERECYELGLRSGGTAASLLTELPLLGERLRSIGA